ncbi:MAG: L-lysine 6-transaminase, partial [Candidatus Kapabacteria bacterium]|nr:L-lysine 6-transaminase [Candidatus Kapabacteria bacterium]
YTKAMADFVSTLFRVAVPSHFTYSFFIEGGALANENAMKVAFDWKVKKNFRKGYTREVGHKIMHFRQAFHGRSGYTMSLTNTDPKKVALFPKFEYPRIHNPALRFPLTEDVLADVIKHEELALNQMRTAFMEHRDEIAAVIMEPIQGEGGDNHFRPEFLQAVRALCDENEALLIFDEVQTGVGITGTWWAHEQLGVQPDIMTFGKKMQVCGLLAGTRVDDIEDNVFHSPSRINSTWGGNLVDMVRATAYLNIINEDNLLANATAVGAYLNESMNAVAHELPGTVSNVRGRGLFAAFDLPSQEVRNKFINKAISNGLLILGCGDHSVRFRPPLDITKERVDEGVAIIKQTVRDIH